MVARCRLLAENGSRSCLSVRTQPLTATGAPSQTSTIPWLCYRRRNQWLRLALALFCLPLIWLARVVYLAYVEAIVFGVGMNIGCEPCHSNNNHNTLQPCPSTRSCTRLRCMLTQPYLVLFSGKTADLVLLSGCAKTCFLPFMSQRLAGS